MTIQIRYATESDVPALAELNIKSFAGQAFVVNIFAGVDREAAYSLKRARYLQKIAHPQTHVLAAVDENSGTIVGCARWVIPGAPPERIAPSETATAGSTLPEGARKDMYDGFFEILKEAGKDHLRDDDIVLEFLATLPEAQGKGVGKALLRWGMDEADRQQKRIYLEATTEGFPVYAKLGWTTVGQAEVDYERWGGKGVQVLTLMTRDPLPYSSGSD